MSKKYDLAVVIGRMQPIHNGHVHLISKALEYADRVLVLFGDTGGPRTIKNPFTPEQRAEMLDKIWYDLKFDGVYSWGELLDDPNDQIWIQKVSDAIKNFSTLKKVCIVGHSKDDSSSYLEWFPQYDFINVGFKMIGSQALNIDATKIRELTFTNQVMYTRSVVPEATYNFLVDWSLTATAMNLKAEYEYIQSYKKSWEVAPYPVIFSTADAVVIQSGHVLLVRREKEIGAGLLALPGGFVEQKDTLFQTALKELKEETGIKLQDEVLERCYKAKEIFDDPGRSLRGRTITTAFLFKLNDACDLPKLNPGKDPDGGTIDAMWVPLNEVKRETMFEDHYFIIQTMLGKLT
jgi:bifunctional NMN adenylyltransferase/nudix hydrolase